MVDPREIRTSLPLMLTVTQSSGAGAGAAGGGVEAGVVAGLAACGAAAAGVDEVAAIDPYIERVILYEAPDTRCMEHSGCRNNMRETILANGRNGRNVQFVSETFPF